MPIYTVIKNLRFDEKNEAKYEKISSLRYDLLNKLLDFDFSKIFMPYDMIIYGAGNIGMNFYKKVKNKFTIRCFIDRTKCGKIDNIPIIWLDRLKNVEKCCFIITATYDYKNIYDTVKRYFPNAMIKSLDEILENKQ